MFAVICVATLESARTKRRVDIAYRAANAAIAACISWLRKPLPASGQGPFVLLRAASTVRWDGVRDIRVMLFADYFGTCSVRRADGPKGSPAAALSAAFRNRL